MACCSAGHQKLWFWQQPRRRYDLWCWKKWACFARQPNNFNIAQCILSPNSDKKCCRNPSHCHCSDWEHPSGKSFFGCAGHAKRHFTSESWASACAGFAAWLCLKLSWLSNTSTTKRPIPGPWHLWHMALYWHTFWIHSNKRWCNDK